MCITKSTKVYVALHVEQLCRTSIRDTAVSRFAGEAPKHSSCYNNNNRLHLLLLSLPLFASLCMSTCGDAIVLPQNA